MKTESFSTPWQTLGTVPVADLVEAKVQLHWAAQIVAAFGNGLLQPQPDDSQSNLGWVDSCWRLMQPSNLGWMERRPSTCGSHSTFSHAQQYYPGRIRIIRTDPSTGV